MRLWAKLTVAASLVELVSGLPQPGLAQTPTPPAAPASSSSAGQSAWVQVAQDSQRLYYLESDASPSHGRKPARSLMEFKIPQVFQGTQVWSIVTNLQVDCDARQTVTVSDTFYSGRMGVGRIVSFNSGQDTWHAIAPGSLGAMAWDLACKAK